MARRTKTPLLATQIALKVGRIKNRYKVAKHFELVIEDGRFEYARRTEAIAREAQLDGFYILRTSEPEDRLATPDVVRSYKNLTNVERAFRREPSASAKRKKTKRETEDGLPLHSFKTLMAEMATASASVNAPSPTSPSGPRTRSSDSVSSSRTSLSSTPMSSSSSNAPSPMAMSRWS